MWVFSSETREDCVGLSKAGLGCVNAVGGPQLTSGDSLLVLLQFQKLNVQLIVLSDQPGILCPVWVQKGIDVLSFFFSLYY